MKLYAIADLHLRYEVTRKALWDLAPHPYDWLILAGDVGETEEHLRFALGILADRFARLLWVPGNHDLRTIPTKTDDLRGQAKYERLVAICREYGVLTPEDPYVTWPGDGERCILAPTFVLYDYTFRPDHVPVEKAVEWAAEENLLCSGRGPSSTPTRSPPGRPGATSGSASPSRAWGRRRSGAAGDHQSLFPLRQDLAIPPRIPRFSIWCGTRLTQDWHLRYRARASRLRPPPHPRQPRPRRRPLRGGLPRLPPELGPHPRRPPLPPPDPPRSPRQAGGAAKPSEGSVYRPAGVKGTRKLAGTLL